MTPPFAPIVLRCVLAGVLAAALLGGCGRKGPLEAPPSSQAAAQPTSAPASGRPTQVMTKDGYPVAPAGERKRIPLDWLID